MAEIHLLPSALDPTRDLRNATALLRAIENGVDLGARGYHIQSIGISLQKTSGMLQQATAALPVVSGQQAAEWQRIESDIAELARKIERLTALCQALAM